MKMSLYIEALAKVLQRRRLKPLKADYGRSREGWILRMYRSSREAIPNGRQRNIRSQNKKEDTVKAYGLATLIFFALGVFVSGPFTGGLSETGSAMAAERQAKDIKVVMYMTTW